MNLLDYIITPVHAQCVKTGIGCIPVDSVGISNKFLSIGIGVVGVIAIILGAYGGYQLMFSGGDPKKVKEGGEILMNAFLGLILVFSSVLILTTIMELLGIKTFFSGIF